VCKFRVEYLYPEVRLEWMCYIHYFRPVYSRDVVNHDTAHFRRVSPRSTETHMFVSGHSANTVAKVGAAGKLY
jgi:hypothetical protein